MKTLQSSIFWKIYAVSLVVMLALISLILFKAENTLPEIAKDKYKQITDETVLRLKAQLENILTDIEVLGTHIQNRQFFQEEDTATLTKELEDIVKLSTFIDSGTVISREGNVIGYYPEDLSSIQHYNLGNRQYFQEAVRMKEIYISDVLQAGSNRYIIAIAIPILDEFEEVVRVVNLALRIEENSVLSSIIQSIELGDGYAYIVDRYGQIISHPDKNRIGDVARSNEVVRKALAHQTGYEMVVNTEGVEMYASYTHVPVLNWVIVAQVPASYTYVYFESFQQSLLIFSMVSFLFLSIFTALYAKQIIKPLQKLSKAVEQVAKGNFHYRIAETDKTEVGQISKRFNVMTAYMEEAQNSLEEKEQLLLEQREFLRNVVNLSPNFIYAKDREGRYTFVNHSMSSFYGLSVEDFLNQTEKMVNPDIEQVKKHEDEEQEVFRSQKELFNHEEWFKNHNGDIRWMQTTKIPLINSKGSVEQVLCVANDLTERKLAEDVIRKTDKQSVAGELAAGVAHEIRNPLTSIQGFLQFIEPNHDEKHFFEIMLSELERINVIVSELLFLAKPQVEHRERKDLRKIFQRMVDLFETQANLKNIQIETHSPNQVLPVMCEENQLKQVFVNLLKNATEAMPNGGKITVQLYEDEKGSVVVKIEDEGQGIEKERISRLGEPFYSTKEKGTGLGLMVSFRIIEKHQGSIYFESEVGKGTTVYIELPKDEA
ncbi:PAS domain-containing sensor histidine kinase [Halalkalibacterium ligniniphilum]|uniref:PAS domain-containing sensor histidine kinase n=1 Tax=Halalkalibacterium ligniniphilum TaxID=1134413 RepID=UPI000363277C|nr:PAS domain-containing sensor histidine kinase [Halalkalibacterium ligniniphilum]